MPWPINNNQINIEILNMPETLEAIKTYFEKEVLPYQNIKEAYWYVANIGLLIKTGKFDNSPFFQNEYTDIFWRCQFMAITWLKEKEIIDLFKEHFSVALQMSENLELWESLRTYLLIYYPLDTRDEFKAKLRRALEENQERITKQQIIVKNQEVEPTVANWLRDYISHIGLNSVKSIDLAEYLSASTNSKRVSPEEKNQLIFLFSLYERLKHSTFSFEGLEEPLGTKVDGKEVTIKDGDVEQLDPKVERLLEKFRKVGLITEKDRESIGGQSEESEEEIVEEKEKLSVKTNETSSPVIKISGKNELQLQSTIGQENNILKSKPEEIKKVVPEKEATEEKMVEAPKLQPVNHISLKKEVVQEVKPNEVIKKEVIPEISAPKHVEPKQVERLKIDVPQPSSFKNLAVNQKLAMSDVRSPLSVVGPVDELRLMNLAELRRIDTNLNRAIDKIYDKIIFLEEESFEKMAEAVNAWRQSPLYRNYLDIVTSSLASGKSIESVIEDERKSNPLSITLAEFKAILALNKRLRV